MSVATRSPISLIGGQLYSGGPRTGEQQFVRGGSLAATFLSGAISLVTTGAPGAVAAAGHVLLWSGAGRLNSAFMHQGPLTNSGVQAVFYDAGTVAGSGVGGSGVRWIGAIGGPGGVSGQQFLPGVPVNFDMPFTSGLCAALPSGVTGVTISWTPEVVPSNL